MEVIQKNKKSEGKNFATVPQSKNNSLDVCEVCGSVRHVVFQNFLSIVPLEMIKSCQRDTPFHSTRKGFYSMILITKGRATETIAYQTYTFEGGTLYFIPENTLHKIQHWSEDIEGYHCSFDSEYFLLCLKNQIKLMEYPFFIPDNDPFVCLKENEMAQLVPLFDKLKHEYTNRQNYNDDLLTRLYLNALLLEVGRMYIQQSAETITHSRQEQLVSKFKRLVHAHFLTYRQVSDYADLLFVHPHYLNDMVRAITGQSASNFIYQHLLAEAKSHLVQSDDTIAQIAARLRFSDQSYFGRFFRKHAGMTPVQFRQQHTQAI
ncbi:AraC family transcriptional regulator [Sphingobacterium spiritivorum]|uniref:AraC family transcriptional regulator n=1 Tax=Sphingobacterium spiritivorum TaxID=258 RepID=UPI0036BEAF57